MSEMVPGRWWRVLDSEYKIWCETSSEEEARAALETASQPALLQRLYAVTHQEWRDEE